MEQLYKNYWADDSCLSAASQTLALGLAVVAAVLLICGLVTWTVLRRQSEGDRRKNARIFALMFGGIAALLCVVAAYVAFSTKSLRRIYVEGGGFIVHICEGARAVPMRIPASNVAGIRYRWRWSGGKAKKQIDEMVITPSTGEPVVMQLSTDPDVLNLPLLKRVAPPEVISGWIAARQERGWPIPPELDAIK